MQKHGFVLALACLVAACGDSRPEAVGPVNDATDVETAAEPAVPAEEMDALFANYLPWPEDEAITTPTGLQYVVLDSAPEGAETVRGSDTVTVHYEGRLPRTGELFDSSFARGVPNEFPAGRLIAGWVEGLELMAPGDDWLLYVPNALAYGDEDRGDIIKAGDDLLFRVKLISVDRTEGDRPDLWAKYLPWDSQREGVVATESGLEYIRVEPPSGSKSPNAGDQIVVDYEGRLADTGRYFDSSYARGEPTRLPLDQTMAGWRELLPQMREGERVVVFVPSDLAYGPRGRTEDRIPPNADLLFEIRLRRVVTVR